jgi:uncharacterized protein with NRDE domain
MCTVSYIPKIEGSGFVLTSNRDEKIFRPTIAPRIYTIGVTKVGFPKDEQAGGTWIASSDKGRLCCLLNGAFVAHQKRSDYAQSRGSVLLELVSSERCVFDFLQEKDLSEIEPFTMLTIEQHGGRIRYFNEFIWDGNTKHFRELDKQQSQIWSSVTLYNTENRKLRKQWFEQFLKENAVKISPEKILAFHSGTHTTDQSIDVVMERVGGMKTVSITQVVPADGKFRMNYIDLQNNTNQEIEL